MRHVTSDVMHHVTFSLEQVKRPITGHVTEDTMYMSTRPMFQQMQLFLHQICNICSMDYVVVVFLGNGTVKFCLDI